VPYLQHSPGAALPAGGCGARSSGNVAGVVRLALRAEGPRCYSQGRSEAQALECKRPLTIQKSPVRAALRPGLPFAWLGYRSSLAGSEAPGFGRKQNTQGRARIVRSEMAYSLSDGDSRRNRALRFRLVKNAQAIKDPRARACGRWIGARQ
jgi:hypothetical protein